MTDPTIPALDLEASFLTSLQSQLLSDFTRMHTRLAHKKQHILYARNALLPGIGRLFSGPMHDVLPLIVLLDLDNPSPAESEAFLPSPIWRSREAGRMVRLLQLAQVSTHWRDAICASRGLWARFEISDYQLRPELFTLFIQRSDGALLDMTISGDLSDELLRTVDPGTYCHELKSLHMVADDRTIDRVLRPDMAYPELTNLSVSLRDNRDYAFSLELPLPPTCRRLRSLSLIDLTLLIPPDAAFVLPRLQTLILVRSSLVLTHPAGPPAQLVRFARDPALATLQLLTALESLYLFDFRLRASVHDAPGPTARTLLPHLRTLQLGFEHHYIPEFVGTLFAHLSLPALTCLKLASSCWDQVDKLLASLPPAVVPSSCLFLEIDGASLASDVLRAFLLSLPALRSLSLTDVTVSLPFLRSLTSPSPGGHTVCPALQDLVLVPRQRCHSPFYEPVTQEELVEIVEEWMGMEGCERKELRSVKYAVSEGGWGRPVPREVMPGPAGDVEGKAE